MKLTIRNLILGQTRLRSPDAAKTLDMSSLGRVRGHSAWAGSRRAPAVVSAVSAVLLLATFAESLASPQFAGALSFDAGNLPNSVAIADLNTDGIPDVAVVNVSNDTPGTVSVLLGNGDGAFRPRTELEAGIGPTYLVIGDLNADGKPDLVVVNRGRNDTDPYRPGAVSVLLGNGDGTFRARTEFTVGFFATCAAIADLNGDGIPDLAVGITYSHYEYDSHTFMWYIVRAGVSVLLGNGDGTFRPRTDFAIGLRSTSLVIGDLNADGKPDLVIRHEGSSVSVLLGNGDGSFGSNTDFATGPSSGSLVIGDLNADGKLDLATAGGSVLLGNGDGTFQGYADDGSRSNAVAIGDLNADGKLDLATAGGSVLLGNGDGTFQEYAAYGTTGNSVAIGDLNADGKPDLAVTNGSYDPFGTVSVLLGNGMFGVPVNRPVLAAIANQTVAEDATADVSVSATDADGDVITLSATLPSFATLTSVPAAGTVNGSIHIAPNFGDWMGSPHWANVTASSGSPVLTGTQDFMIAVTHVNRSPSLAQPSAMTVNEGMTADQTLTGTDPDGDGVTFSLASGPSFASVATTSPGYPGKLHLAPGFSDGNGSPTTYTATVTASDGALTDSKSLAITVNNTNRPPVVSAPLSVSTFEGSLVAFSVSATDPDGDPATVAVLNLPDGATFIDNGGGAGSFNWTPGFSQAGTYNVSFIARDNQGAISAPRAVTIMVGVVNRPPISIAGGPYSGVVNVPITFNGTGSSDPDGSPLTYLWDFGDGMTGVGVTPQHAYTMGGTFTVVLTVSDGFLSGNASSIATIQDTFPARAFTTSGYGTIRLGSGKASWCVQVEPEGGSYLITAVLGPTITMKYGARQILASAGKASIGADKDENGIQELTACFSKSDLRTLFSGLPKGTNTVSVTLEGDLSTGGKFRATLTIDVVSTGAGVAATVSPNPLNPEATLSFTISRPGRVRVSVYGLDGRLVRTLLEGAFLEAGRHDLQIDGRSDAGTRLASGIYFYRIEAPDGAATGQFAIMK